MALKQSDFLMDVWAFHNRKKVHPYKGERGEKKGLHSVNFTNDTNHFEGMSEEGVMDPRPALQKPLHRCGT